MRSKLKVTSFAALLVCLSCLLILPMVGQNGKASAKSLQPVAYNQKDFIKRLAPQAKELSKIYGVKPSVILGQAALSSDYGANLLGSKYHNLFGLKVAAGETGIALQHQEFSNGSWQKQVNRYRIYRSWDDAMRDYLMRLRKGEFGDSVLYQTMATTTSYKTAAKALQAAQFSTDPEYGNQLMAIIEANQLTDYD